LNASAAADAKYGAAGHIRAEERDRQSPDFRENVVDERVAGAYGYVHRHRQIAGRTVVDWT